MWLRMLSRIMASVTLSLSICLDPVDPRWLVPSSGGLGRYACINLTQPVTFSQLLQLVLKIRDLYQSGKSPEVIVLSDLPSSILQTLKIDDLKNNRIVLISVRRVTSLLPQR